MAKPIAWMLCLALGGVPVQAAQPWRPIVPFSIADAQDPPVPVVPPSTPPAPVGGGAATNPTGDSTDPGLDGPVALPNFHMVSSGIYRSAQPNREGFSDLASGNYPDASVGLFGQTVPMSTILTLRDMNGLDAPIIKQEQQLVTALGMHSISISMDGSVTPPFKSVDDAMSLLINKFNYPILVHCKDGKDRTGYVIAAFRVYIEKMDIDQAVAEAKSFGCCNPNFSDLKTFLQSYLTYRAKADSGF